MNRGLWKAVVVAFVVAVVTPAGAATAGVTTASTSPTSSGPLDGLTCASPPAGVQASAEARDRFVALWTTRIADKQWVQSFVDAPTVPAAVMAEGFHQLDATTQSWLVACLVDNLVKVVGVDGNPPGVAPVAARIVQIRGTVALVIFGKAEINKLKADATRTTPVSDTSTPPQVSALTGATEALAATPVPPLPDAGQVPPDAVANAVSDLSTTASPVIQSLLSSIPSTIAVDAAASAQVDLSAATPVASASIGALVAAGLGGSLSLPPLHALTTVLASLARDLATVPQSLLSTPAGSFLGGATYKVCSETAVMPLACTVPLPIGVPTPVDTDGDLVPDFLAWLTPQPNLFALQDVSVGFSLTRIATAPPGPIPAHVFVVYDPPLSSKRFEFGFDGRASTLADQTTATATVKNVAGALSGDVNVQLKITHKNPGPTETETFALKGLVSQGLLKPLVEVDPLTGAVQFTPVPASLTANVHLLRTPTQSQATVALTSSVATRVDAQVNRDLTTTTPNSHQETRALIDKLPTSATVDMISQGDKTKIHYFANAGIDHVSASNRLVPDIAYPSTYVEGIYDVLGVPTDVTVTLTGGSDVLYNASGPVTQASVGKNTLQEGVVQTSLLAQVNQVPTNVHVVNAAGGDTDTVTYDADASLGSAKLVMYNRAADQTLLTATATGIPTHAVLASTKSSGVVDYTSSGPIQQISATLTRNEGAVLSLPGDHASVLKQANKLGAELVLSGLQTLHADPSQKARYDLTLSPGGQAFKAVADLDSPNVLANLDISNLPPTVSVTLDPAGGAATYTAAAVVDSVKASFQKRDTGMFGLVEADGVPTSVKLNFATTGATPQVTYDASGKLTKLHALYLEKPGGTTFDGVIDRLPEYFTVSGQDPFGFDARTGPAAAAASSSVGRITLRYGSDGVFATSPTPDDHLVLQTGAATHAELVYSGLRLVSASTATKALHVDLRNTQKRLFRAFIDTPSLAVQGFIDGVPDSVTVDVAGQSAKYRATSTVDEVAVRVDRRNGESASVDVKGIPQSIDLVFDSAASKVDWVASDATTSLGVLATFGPPSTGSSRTFNAALTLTGIPARWNVSYAAGHPRFEGTSGPIAGLDAKFTNHGVTTVLAGDHLSAVFDQPSGDLDTSLHISNLSLAEFQKLATGFSGDLNMGSGSPFGLNAKVNLGSSLLSLTGTISNLPSSLHIDSANGVFNYSANTNPTINLTASYGNAAALAATPTPPSVHGLAVRDGSGCVGATCGPAVKANLFLTGFPRQLKFDAPAGVYSVKNFAPTSALVVDARLTALVPSPLKLTLTQAGIPPGTDFTYGPTTTKTLADGTAQSHLGYTANGALGPLSVTASFGSDEAFFSSTSVPSSLSVDTSFGPDSKTIGIVTGSTISEINAMYRHVGDATFSAGAKLDHVPKSIALVLGKQDGGQGVTTPVFSYHADSAGLDLNVFANANLFGGQVRAAAQLSVTNFGKDVTAGLAGTQLQIASSPPTTSFNLLASGHLEKTFDLKFDAGPLQNHGSLFLSLDIFSFNVFFHNLSSLTADLGVTSAFRGTYGDFGLAERSDLKLSIHDGLDLDLGIHTFNDFITFDKDLDLGNVIGNFRMATNHLGGWQSACIPPVRFSLDLMPHPHSTTAGSSFTVSSATAEGSPPAWLVTPNPLGIIPDFVLDIIARFASPLGGDQGFSVEPSLCL